MASNGTNLGSQIQGNHFPAAARPESEQPWQVEYMAALFETDGTQMGNRIALAERLILRRERELLAGRPEPVEQRALKSALEALRALRRCLEI